jgi:hypothetical protein
LSAPVLACAPAAQTCPLHPRRIAARVRVCIAQLDAQHETHYKDGGKRILYPDGTVKTQMPSGEQRSVFPDGTTLIQSPGGSTRVIEPPARSTG